MVGVNPLAVVCGWKSRFTHAARQNQCYRFDQVNPKRFSNPKIRKFTHQKEVCLSPIVKDVAAF